jgi:uncharacterized membrane protein
MHQAVLPHEEAVSAQKPAPAPAPQRLNSVDAVRGLIMIVMALDHTRDFLGRHAFTATDLTKTTPAYFFTRWITHYCAPGFMLLAGTGAYLSAKSRPALSRFLVSRGLWLVFAELTFIGFAWTFTIGGAALQVIWALGWSMVVLAALIWLPLPLLAGLAVTTIVLHNAFDGIHAAPLFDSSGKMTGTAADWAIAVLHQQDMPILYPLIPWVAVMALGYTLGPIFRWEPRRRTRALLSLGLGSIAGFVLLRALNVYGDSSRWAAQPRAGFTVLSFLNTTKYPPSLLYLLMTLGPLFLALAAAERLRGPVERVLVVYGRAPFFYYVLHLYLIHTLAVLLGVARGIPAGTFFSGFWRFPPDFGLELGAVYAAWAGVVAALYLPTKWWAGLKARRRDWWLSYL